MRIFIFSLLFFPAVVFAQAFTPSENALLFLQGSFMDAADDAGTIVGTIAGSLAVLLVRGGFLKQLGDFEWC